jgi:hypothetical protein
MADSALIVSELRLGSLRLRRSGVDSELFSLEGIDSPVKNSTTLSDELAKYIRHILAVVAVQAALRARSSASVASTLAVVGDLALSTERRTLARLLAFDSITAADGSFAPEMSLSTERRSLALLLATDSIQAAASDLAQIAEFQNRVDIECAEANGAAAIMRHLPTVAVVATEAQGRALLGAELLRQLDALIADAVADGHATSERDDIVATIARQIVDAAAAVRGESAARERALADLETLEHGERAQLSRLEALYFGLGTLQHVERASRVSVEAEANAVVTERVTTAQQKTDKILRRLALLRSTKAARVLQRFGRSIRARRRRAMRQHALESLLLQREEAEIRDAMELSAERVALVEARREFDGWLLVERTTQAATALRAVLLGCEDLEETARGDLTGGESSEFHERSAAFVSGRTLLQTSSAAVTLQRFARRVGACALRLRKLSALHRCWAASDEAADRLELQLDEQASTTDLVRAATASTVERAETDGRGAISVLEHADRSHAECLRMDNSEESTRYQTESHLLGVHQAFVIVRHREGVSIVRLQATIRALFSKLLALGRAEERRVVPEGSPIYGCERDARCAVELDEAVTRRRFELPWLAAPGSLPASQLVAARDSVQEADAARYRSFVGAASGDEFTASAWTPPTTAVVAMTHATAPEWVHNAFAAVDFGHRRLAYTSLLPASIAQRSARDFVSFVDSVSESSAVLFCGGHFAATLNAALLARLPPRAQEAVEAVDNEVRCALAELRRSLTPTSVHDLIASIDSVGRGPLPDVESTVGLWLRLITPRFSSTSTRSCCDALRAHVRHVPSGASRLVEWTLSVGWADVDGEAVLRATQLRQHVSRSTRLPAACGHLLQDVKRWAVALADQRRILAPTHALLERFTSPSSDSARQKPVQSQRTWVAPNDSGLQRRPVWLEPTPPTIPRPVTAPSARASSPMRATRHVDAAEKRNASPPPCTDVKHPVESTPSRRLW